MGHSPILLPVVSLVAWSCVMLVWLYATRLPAMARARLDLKGRVRGRGGSLDGVVPDPVQWKAHNYTHLMEQPTLFYAIALLLALIGQGGGLNLALAWGYVACRILHSLVQATVNIVRYRTALFAVASAFLIALTGRAIGSLIG